MRHAQIFEETERRVAKESSAVKASRYLKDFSKISLLAGKNSPSFTARQRAEPSTEREGKGRPGTLFRSLPLLKKKSRETHTLLSHRNTKSVIAAGKKVNVTTEFCAAIATCIRKQRKICFSVEAFQSHIILSLVNHPLHHRNGREAWVSGVEGAPKRIPNTLRKRRENCTRTYATTFYLL
jgi:hypothetical protein